MKRLKFYLSMILVVCILASTSTVALASNINWIMNSVLGVSEYIYDSTPYGFIIHGYDDEDNYYAAVVNDEGYVVEPTNNYFTMIDDNGYISYYNNGNYGVMDMDGNTVIPEGVYDEIIVLNKDRFAVIKDIDGMYRYAIIDANENEIVPYGTYGSFYSMGTILAYDDNGNRVALIDYDGNVIVEGEEIENITILPATDRYLYYDEASGMSYIRALDGSVIAEIEGEARFRMYNAIDVNYLDEAADTLYIYIYDMDGNALDAEIYENYSQTWGIPYTAINVEGVIDEKYFIAQDDTSDGYVVDEDDNVIFSDPELIAMKVCNDKYILVTDTSWDSIGIVSITGETIVPLDEYMNIAYSEEFDIFAFENMEGIVSIGKLGSTGVNDGTVTVKLDGEKIKFDQTPIIKEGRTLVPMRAIFEAFGADIYWDDATKTVTSNFNGITVTLKIGSNVLKVNDKEITLDVPAEILNGRTIVPVRAISEAFECNVDWDDATKTVLITR